MLIIIDNAYNTHYASLLSIVCAYIHICQKQIHQTLSHLFVVEQLTDLPVAQELAKANPSRLIPTLDDNGFYLFESYLHKKITYFYYILVLQHCYSEVHLYEVQFARSLVSIGDTQESTGGAVPSLAPWKY